MSNRIELSASARGSWDEKEDWWHLVTNDDGTMHVEHEWSHTNAYKSKKSNSGTKQIAIEDFLSGDHNSGAQRKLREELARIGAAGRTSLAPLRLSFSS